MAQDTVAQLRERFEASPADRAAFEALEEHLFVRGEWASLVALYEDRLGATDLDTESGGQKARRARAGVVFRLGQVLEERRIEPERAIARYREVLALQPDHRPAMQQLRGLLARREEWEAVLALAEQESQLPMSPAERAQFAAEIGALHETRMDDAERALACYAEALQLAPDHVDALLGSARTHTQLGDTRAARSDLERACERLQGPGRAAALVAWAALLDEESEGTLREDLYRRALEDDPRSEPALEALSRLAFDRGDWEAFDDLCERRFSVAVGAVRRVAVAHDAARSLLGPGRNPRAARRWLERALELFPGDPVVHFQLADCEGLAGNPGAREPHLRMGWELAGDATPLDVLRECAELSAERGDFDQSAADLKRLIELEGPTARSVSQLGQVLERAGRQEELEPVLARMAGDLEGPAAADVWLRLADLREARDDAAAAGEAIEQALEAAPAHAAALERWERRLAREERWDELAARLERAWHALPEGDDAWAALGLRLADLQGERMGDGDAATATFERILERRPEDAAARRGLERMALASGDSDAIVATFSHELDVCRDPERARFLAFELVRLHEREERPEEALAVLGRLAERIPEDREALEARARLERATGRDAERLATLQRLDAYVGGPDQAALRRELAALHRAAGRVEPAIAAHRGALEADPTDLESLRALDALLEEAGQHEELAEVRARLARRLPPEERAHCRTRLAALLEEALSDLPGAIAALEQALDDPQPPAEAALRLERLLERTGRDEELCARLERRRAAIGDDEAEARALDRRRAALLLDRLDRPGEAASLLADLFEAAPDDADLEAELERALRAARRNLELEALLARRCERVDDADLRTALCIERAELLIARGGHEREASALLEPIAAGEGPRAAEAHALLTRTLERAGDPDALRAHLEAGLGRAQDDAARLALHERLAALCRDHLRDDAGAARHLDAATHLAPERVDLWQALQRLHFEADRPEALLDAYEGELATAPADDRALWLATHALELARTLDDGERLDAHAARLLELDPGHPAAFEHRVSRLEAEERPEEIARLLAARIGAAESRRDEAGSREAAGTGDALRASAAAGSGDALRASAAAGSGDALRASAAAGSGDALRASAAGGSGDALRASAAGGSGDALRASAAGSEALSLRLRLAALLSGALDDAAGAVEVLEPLAGGERLALVAEPLADLYERTGAFEALAALAAQAAQGAEDSDERASWWRRLAWAQLRQGDLAASAEAQRRVLAERPGDAAAREALRSLYAELREFAPLARLLEVELADAGGSEEVSLRLELARILRDELARPDEALSHLERALSLDPHAGEALAAGLELAEQLGRDESWLSLSRLALARQPGPEAAARLLRGRARRLMAQAPDEAIGCLREAVAAMPGHAETRHALRDALDARGDLDGWLSSAEEEVAADRERDPQAAAALCEEAARRAEEARGAEAALPWLLRLRSLRPDDASVLARMAAIHRAAGRTADLLRCLDAELALGPAPARRTELSLERAELLAAEGALDAAIAALEAARDASPESELVLERLDALLERAGRLEERCFVLASRIATASGAERAELRRTLCACERKRGNPAAAARALWMLLAESQPSGVARAELLRELGDLLLDAGDERSWAAVAETELAGLASDPVFDERRCVLHRDLARLWSRHAGRPGRARAHWAGLLDAELVTPDGPEAELFCEAEEGLLDALRRLGDDVALEARLAARLARKQSEPGPEHCAGWLELGQLRLERLQRPAAAAAAFRMAGRCDPDSLGAIRGLRSACERLSRAHDVAETLDRELAVRSDASPHERAALLRRLGFVSWRELADTPRAAAAFEQALEAVPEDLAALRALCELAEATEDHAGALARYEQELALLGDAEPERRARLWVRCAELARDHAGDARRALSAFAEAERAAGLPLGRRLEWAELLEAEGDTASFARVFGVWCDAPDSDAGPADQLRLAHALRALGEDDAAMERVQRAVAGGSAPRGAHDLLAELCEARGDTEAASRALEEAARQRSGTAAAERRLQAARLVEERDAERAFELAFRASVDDPAHAGVQAALARIAAAGGQQDVAQTAAARGLELDARGALPESLRFETALIGARASRAREQLAECAGFLDEALRLRPHDPEALASQGEVRFALGDLEAARSCLEARLSLDAPDAQASLHRAQLGTCLRAAGRRDDAIACFREALEADASLEAAHAGLADALEEAAGEGVAAARAEAVAALRAYAALSDAGPERARHLLRAARLEIAVPQGRDAGEALLREALETAPEEGAAHVLLAGLLEEQGRRDEAYALARDAREVLQDPAFLAPLARICGRALVTRSDARGAAEAFEAASHCDPSDADSALEAARLLRGLGEWRRAAEVLQGYCDAAEEAAPEHAAPVLCQLGRLLAGPLESLAAAVDVYERALRIDPGLEGVREALAAILAHLPERWDEAARCHGALLAEDPTRVASLRALVQIAEGRGQGALVESGLCILTALGAATPCERERAPQRPDALLDRVPLALADTTAECARQLAREAAAEIAEALEGGGRGAGPGAGASPVARFRAAALAREGELSAPALVPLPTEQLAAVLTLAARLADSTGTVQGDGHLVNALSAALGRRARKRVRRVLGERPPESLGAIDFHAWRVELRSLASLAVLRDGEGSLRAALLAWALDDDSEPLPPDEGDISARVAASPEARGLLARLVEALIEASGV